MISESAVFAHAQNIVSILPDSSLQQPILIDELTFHAIFHTVDESEQLAYTLLDKAAFYHKFILDFLSDFPPYPLWIPYVLKGTMNQSSCSIPKQLYKQNSKGPHKSWVKRP